MFLFLSFLVISAPALHAQQTRLSETRPAVSVDSLATLGRNLQSGNPSAHAFAQHQFRRLGIAAEGAVPELVRLTMHPNAEVRLRAVDALGAIGSGDSASVLALARAATDPDPRVQSEALTWLTLFKTDAAAAAPALVPLLRSNRSEVRARAAAALGNIGVPATAVPVMLELLRDTSPRVRNRAAYALRRAPRPDLVVPALIATLQDEDGAVVVNAALALGEAGRALPNEAVPALATVVQGTREGWLKAEAARALGEIGRPAGAGVPALVAALSQEDGYLRETAAWALNRIIGPDGGGEGICKHRPTEGPVPASVTLEGGRATFRSDGGGPYRNGQAGVQASHGTAFNLQLRPPRESIQPSRSFVVDLRYPVPGSGAVSLGEIRDATARFHTFYMIDADSVIWNTQDIPVGATVLSDRTQMNFFIGGVPHLLQMGPWGLGDCNEGYAEGGRFHGQGTTQVQITRTSEASYTVTAPAGSIARLWDQRRLSSPVDRGLYYVQFTVRLNSNE